MKYLKIFTLLVVAIAITSCSEDELNSQSIFDTSVPERNEFDKWLLKNYTDNYNISFRYRYTDKETDQTYNVIPADIDKSKALAIMIKNVWLDTYKEVAGADFLKTYAPRVYQLIGSGEYNSQGSIILGTAEGGIKVTLFRVNSLDIDNPYIEQDNPFRNHTAVPADLNFWYFHTMHHEFCHILTQTKDYSTDFRTISAGKYHTSDWVNVKDTEAPAMGFVTGYASGEYNEDFAEIFSTYVTYSPEGWQKLLDAGKVVVKDANGNIVYAVDKKGNYIYKLDKDGNKVPEKNANGTLVPLINNGQMVYKTDAKGNPVYYTVGGKKVQRYTGQEKIVYLTDKNGNLVIAFEYNGTYYNVTAKLGEPVYQTDADGNTVYDKDGNPVPEYYKIPELQYEREPLYDETGANTIIQKLAIVKKYFKTSWNIDIDVLRDEVLKRSAGVKELNLRTLD